MLVAAILDDTHFEFKSAIYVFENVIGPVGLGLTAISGR